MTGVLDFVGEYMTDHLGRKRVFIFVLFVQILAFIMNIFIDGFWTNMIGNGLIIVSVTLNYSLLIVIMSESLPSSHRNRMATIFFMSELTGYLVFTMIEMY